MHEIRHNDPHLVGMKAYVGQIVFNSGEFGRVLALGGTYSNASL